MDQYPLATCLGETQMGTEALRGKRVTETGWGWFRELGVPTPPSSDFQVQIRHFPNGRVLCPALAGGW